MIAVQVEVPAQRVQRWVANFIQRHGALIPTGGSADGTDDVSELCSDRRYVAEDGSWFEFRAAFPDAGEQPLVCPPAPPPRWAVLIVRKGGFAVARLEGESITSSKVGRRHVQGRSKAGGQSQQRFARRRENQARDAYRAAADYAAEHTAGLDGPVVTAGDEAALRHVMGDGRLDHLEVLHRGGDVAEPRRDTLEDFVRALLSWQVTVHNAS